MILLRLFFEFGKVGLFSVGGGLATIPFLQRMGEETGWFTHGELSTMIAVSESTPGPMGVNMASYVGFTKAGIPGAVAATLGLITPTIVVIILIAGFLQKFQQSKTVDRVFYGLRPASTALIASAGLTLAGSTWWKIGGTTEHTLSIQWPMVLLSGVVFLALQNGNLKKLHPLVFIVAAAVIGVVFQL